MRSNFSCVRSSHDLCARAHAHSLEGTLLMNEHELVSKLVGKEEFNSEKNSVHIQSGNVGGLRCSDV